MYVCMHVCMHVCMYNYTYDMCMLHTSSPKGETAKSMSSPTGKKPFLPIVTLSTEVESSNSGGTT